MLINVTQLVKTFIIYCHQINAKSSATFLMLLMVAPTLVQAAEKSDMRGKRYCEIVVSKALTRYAVYNTLGLNDCPENMWDKVTIAQVKKETGASFVYLNGPRYWVIDGFKNSNLHNPTIQTINGLTMREAGLLSIKLADLFKASAPYYKHDVTRHTTWIYQSGKPIYELIDANGDVFVMQSYGIQKSPQTENSLSELGAKLKLPKDWVFKTGILKQIEPVEAINNRAIVIQDNLENTYQKASHDFLKKEKEAA